MTSTVTFIGYREQRLASEDTEPNVLDTLSFGASKRLLEILDPIAEFDEGIAVFLLERAKNLLRCGYSGSDVLDDATKTAVQYKDLGIAS